jgi:hypothetical protein
MLSRQWRLPCLIARSILLFWTSVAAASEPQTEAHTATVRTPLIHCGPDVDGWYVSTSDNFRIRHQLSVKFAEGVAEAAEKARGKAQELWLGNALAPWRPRCEIRIHLDGQAYWRETGVLPASRGHSRFVIEEGRVLCRSIELRADDSEMLSAILPHEVTHAVIAGLGGDRPVPRWADEGMAILAEPAKSTDAYRVKLLAAGDHIFALKELMEMDYPVSSQAEVFYAQSASLVRFLARQKDGAQFTTFLRDCMRLGCRTALDMDYGYRDLDQLRDRWRAATFAKHSSAGSSTSMGVPGSASNALFSLSNMPERVAGPHP